MAAILGILLLCVPDRQPLGPAEREPCVPFIAGPCHYGEIYQDGRRVQVRGEKWSADGWIRDDGTLYLLWRTWESVAICHSMYEIRGEQIRGRFGPSLDSMPHTDTLRYGR